MTPPPSPRILLRSSWQTVNIGDIAHTPGLLQLLQKHLPEVRITLWAGKLNRGVRPMLERFFPDVEIIEEGWDENGAPNTPESLAAWHSADFFLHGSGPHVVAENSLRAWREQTGKPYGIIGVTIENPGTALVDLLNGAEFVYTRETASISHLEKARVSGPSIAFAPDATFDCHITNEAEGEEVLTRLGLSRGEFLCAIPRLRYTPYYKIHGRERTPQETERDAVNAQWVEHDLGKLREIITAWVRETGRQVLVCPEMTYEVELGLDEIYSKLPPDVQPNVKCLDFYWLTDVASAVFAQSAGVASLECHSPILAIEQGVPAIYVRQPTDTIKGQMYRDLGLADWIFEIEQDSAAVMSKSVLKFASDAETSRSKAKEAAMQAKATLNQAALHLREVLSKASKERSV
jgi:hypothetical protein